MKPNPGAQLQQTSVHGNVNAGGADGGQINCDVGGMGKSNSHECIHHSHITGGVVLMVEIQRWGLPDMHVVLQ